MIMIFKANWISATHGYWRTGAEGSMFFLFIGCIRQLCKWHWWFVNKMMSKLPYILQLRLNACEHYSLTFKSSDTLFFFSLFKDLFGFPYAVVIKSVQFPQIKGSWIRNTFSLIWKVNWRGFPRKRGWVSEHTQILNLIQVSSFSIQN